MLRSPLLFAPLSPFPSPLLICSHISSLLSPISTLLSAHLAWMQEIDEAGAQKQSPFLSSLP
uniref:Uncharacterized protein n=1 Tax=Arundo donax TaxID=35708 RepID=A0A0A9C5I1_ARUDO